MALIRCSTSGGGGGELTRTPLWSNGSPTSNMPANTSSTYADATLSESLNNFTYVEIIYKGSKSESITADSANARAIIIETSKFENVADYTGKYGLMAIISSTWYAREFRLQNLGNTVRFYPCYALNSATRNDGYCIPLAINGLK